MVLKMKNANKISEFKPIAMLPTISKIFESIICDQVYPWAEKRKSLIKSNLDSENVSRN